MVASSGTCAWHQVIHNHGLQAHVSKTTHCKYAHILRPGPVYDLVAQHLIRRCLSQGDMASNMTSGNPIFDLHVRSDVGSARQLGKLKTDSSINYTWDLAE